MLGTIDDLLQEILGLHKQDSPGKATGQVFFHPGRDQQVTSDWLASCSSDRAEGSRVGSRHPAGPAPGWLFLCSVLRY